MAGLVACLPLAGCAPRAGDLLQRRGDEIVVCGQLFHTGTPVVLWLDPGGYDAYRLEKRFSPPATQPGSADAEPARARYGSWRKHLSPEALESVWREGWTLAELRRQVDLFVLHYDVCGTSQRCFNVLHDHRGLSVHFMLDVDGVIYQTLDLKERAWHAGSGNDRSIGVEIAQIGAYEDPAELDRWTTRDADGRLRLVLPAPLLGNGIRTPDFVPRPARNELVTGTVHGTRLHQFDFTPQQYAALARLSATLCRTLPRIRPDFPREADGAVAMRELTPAELASFSGILGHYHLTRSKVDPGPALDWQRLSADLQRHLLQ